MFVEHNSNGLPQRNSTHVAGTIGAVGNNTIGVVGVNWNIKMISGKFLHGNTGGYTSDAIAAIDYMVTLKTQQFVNLKVLSNSWGGGEFLVVCALQSLSPIITNSIETGPFSQSLLDAINSAGDADILFVAAAGNAAVDNDVNPSYPANYQCTTKANGDPRGYDCVISVASITSSGAMSDFSQYGAHTVDM